MIPIQQNQSKLVPTLTWLGGGIVAAGSPGGAVCARGGIVRVLSCMPYVPIKAWCKPMETMVAYRDGWYEHLVSVAAVGVGLLLFINEGKQKAPRRLDLRWLVVLAILILLIFDFLLGMFFIPGGICLLLASIAAAWLAPRRRLRRA